MVRFLQKGETATKGLDSIGDLLFKHVVEVDEQLPHNHYTPSPSGTVPENLRKSGLTKTTHILPLYAECF
jgi:hypothetical protein